MDAQTTDTVLMVRPARFGFDAETAGSNAFQRDLGLSSSEAAERGLEEFDRVAAALRGAGVRVLVMEDTPEPAKPDAVFPNNWFSTHAVDGRGVVVVYPMATPMRRLERRVDALVDTLRAAGKRVDEVIDLSGLERGGGGGGEGVALEGTGSMVLDRVARVALACRSPRTDEGALRGWCERMGYTPVVCEARDARGVRLYHTNVLAWIGRSVAGVGLGCVGEPERSAVRSAVMGGGRAVVELSPGQIERFAGNALEVRSAGGGAVLALSGTAAGSLLGEQRSVIESHAAVLAVEIPTIEALGGGSVRCMLAEVFLPDA